MRGVVIALGLLALALPRRPLVAAGALLVLGYAVVQAPGVLSLWFVPTLVLNVAGGLLLVTALRLIRTKELLAERRGAAPRLRR